MAYKRYSKRKAPAYRRRASYARSTSTTRRRKPANKRAPAKLRSSKGLASSREVQSGEKFVLAQLDPFVPQVDGAKIPDSNTIPSIACKDVELRTLPLTTTTNVTCNAFTPSYPCAFVQATEGAGSWAWPAAFGGASTRGKFTAYANEFELDRTVAHGVRITSSVAPTSATGYVHIAIAFESHRGSPAITTWQWPTTVAGLAGYQNYKRVTLASLTQEPLIVVNKYVDDTAFRYSDAGVSDFNAASLASGFALPRSWGSILIAIEGSNAVSPISVEDLIMTEAIPKSTGAVRGSMAAPPNPTLLAAASQATANAPPTRPDSAAQASVNAAAERLRNQVGAAAGRVRTMAWNWGADQVQSFADDFISGHSNPLASFQTINTQTLTQGR
nr:MAG: putative capsid protein [Arizlama virus]